MDLKDSRWKQLNGARRTPYDASIPLKKLKDRESPAEIWAELWENLCHQGNVGEASYAAVTQVVDILQFRPRDWNFYALIAAIELARAEKGNPPVPPWLEEQYQFSLSRVVEFGAKDILTVKDALTLRGILAAIAAAKGALKLSKMMFLGEDEMDEILSQLS